MSTVDIENTEVRLLIGPHDESMQEVRLVPGMNHIDEKLWSKVRNAGSVPSWIKMGWIKEYGNTPEAQDLPSDMDEGLAEIRKMKASEAVVIIESADLSHLDFLEAVAARDNRATVVTAARLKIDALKK